jgi:hypothetical protein
MTGPSERTFVSIFLFRSEQLSANINFHSTRLSFRPTISYTCLVWLGNNLHLSPEHTNVTGKSSAENRKHPALLPDFETTTMPSKLRHFVYLLHVLLISYL